MEFLMSTKGALPGYYERMAGQLLIGRETLFSRAQIPLMNFP